jgi:hypothetical protein
VRLQALVSLLQSFDVAEPTARMTTAGLRRTGWLDATRRGRETLYAPTERLRGAVRRRWTRVDERLGPWDGHWRMVIYTVPETDRSARDRVRRTLARHGFGPLAPATWLSPHGSALDEVRAEPADEPLGRLDLLTARVAAGTAGGDAEVQRPLDGALGLRLFAGAWNSLSPMQPRPWGGTGSCPHGRISMPRCARPPGRRPPSPSPWPPPSPSAPVVAARDSSVWYIAPNGLPSVEQMVEEVGAVCSPGTSPPRWWPWCWPRSPRCSSG